MSMRPQVSVKYGEKEENLSFIQQMGISYVSLGLDLEQVQIETIKSEQQRLLRYGLRVSDAYCMKLQKNRAIILGKEERKGYIELFQKMIHVFGCLDIPFTSIAWQPNGVLRSARTVGQYTRGGISAIADQKEIEARPILEDHIYTEEDMWNSFSYFIEKILPECEKYNVKLALHPNDPPLPDMEGVHSLIYNSACFDRAFSIAGNSPFLGMKLCVGCWLEGGDSFGDLFEDIEHFNSDGRILCVHFRNVSSTLPYFEETLAEDGYANMYAIMKALVKSNCDAVISIDHAFRGNESLGGRTVNMAYPTGYLKGLLHAAESELNII